MLLALSGPAGIKSMVLIFQLEVDGVGGLSVKMASQMPCSEWGLGCGIPLVILLDQKRRIVPVYDVKSSPERGAVRSIGVRVGN